MSEGLLLNDRQFKSAIKVLEREQQSLLPSAWELLFYYVFHVMMILLVVLLALLFFGVVTWSRIVAGADWIWPCIVIPLFCLNIPFTGKLWRLANLRRRLGLAADIRAVYKRQHKLWRKVLFILTVVAITVAAVASVSLILINFRYDSPFLWTLISVVLSLLSLTFMRSGKAKLAVVRNLQQLLADMERDGSGEDPLPTIPPYAWQDIARIERAQIIRDRQSSLKIAAKQGRNPDYTVMQSRAVLHAKAQLDPSTNLKVEERIFALLGNPSPHDVLRNPDTGLRIVQIPDTPLEIGYQVDEEAQCIQIHYVAPPGAGEEGAGGHG